MRTRWYLTVGLLLCCGILACISTTTPVQVSSGQTLELRRLKYYTSAGNGIDAIYCHPHPYSEARLPAVIYNHDATVENRGYDGAIARYNYDVAKFVAAFAEHGYVALAPIRSGNPVSDKNCIDGAIRFLMQQRDVDGAHIGLTGLGKGGTMAMEFLFTNRDVSSVKAVVLMSPALWGDHWLNPIEENCVNLDNIGIPTMIMFGANDNQDFIYTCKNGLAPQYESFGHTLSIRSDYPGDFQWFHQVRAEYFNDLLAFLDSELHG